MMKGNIGLNAAMIKSSKTILNNLLADHFVLLAKTWNYHWNMKGRIIKPPSEKAD